MLCNCLFWAIVYMIRTPSIRLFGVQVVVTQAVAVGASLVAELSVYALLAVFPATLCCALWMAPVGIISSYLHGGLVKQRVEDHAD